MLLLIQKLPEFVPQAHTRGLGFLNAWLSLQKSLSKNQNKEHEKYKSTHLR